MTGEILIVDEALAVGDVAFQKKCIDWIDKFRRSGAGSVIAAGLLGVRDALEGRPEREEPAIVSEAPEPKRDHIDIVLDPDHPERSRAVVYLPPRDDTSRDSDA